MYSEFWWKSWLFGQAFFSKRQKSWFFGVLFLNEPVYNAHIQTFSTGIRGAEAFPEFRVDFQILEVVSRGMKKLLERSKSRVSMYSIYIILFFHIWNNSRRFHRIQIGVRIFKSRISVGDSTTKIHFTQNFFIEKCDF